MANVLIADDCDAVGATMSRVLQRRGFETALATNGEEAVQLARAHAYDLAFIDLVMPKGGGIDVLKFLAEVSPRTHVVIMTGHATLDSAIEALRHRAVDYLLKPFTIEELDGHIDRILARLSLPLDVADTAPAAGGADRATDGLIGGSTVMQQIQVLVDRVAQTASPVLLLGESGTGKEVLAQLIHARSPRSIKPFVAINCVALAEGVLESELFGHEKGAFTGAVAQKMGLLETAAGGTLFLDEIGELSLAIQVKLLRFLQEHEIQRVGGMKTIKVEVRIIAATNRDLHAEVDARRFRDDLLYRLNVFEIRMPPLRERMEDLALLVPHFLAKFQRILGKRATLTTRAMRLFATYGWPGNIRELEHVIERALILSDNGTIDVEELPTRMVRPEAHQRHAVVAPEEESESGALHQLAETELAVIRKALEMHRWNQSRAAKHLGIKRTTLQYRMQKYNLLQG